MRATLKSSLLLLIASASVLTSCKKQDIKAYLSPSGSMQFNTTLSTNSTITLLQVNAASNVGSFTWTAADFGYKAAVTYSIQMCKGGTNFSSSATTTEVAAGSGLSKTMTVGELNAKMQEIISDGVATPVDMRVKADVGSGVTPLYSNVIKFTINSYLDIVSYGFPDAMNIAGNGQSPQWDPPTSPQICKVRNGGYATTSNPDRYEGYIIFNAASPEFKMVRGNNWGAGDHGSAGPGTLTSNGGPNLTLPSGGAGVAGLYRIRADRAALTWSYDKINTFGIIGSATAGGWSSSTPMTFNPANGSWSITADLVAGELKFRANNDWAINFGDNNNPIDNKPEYDGSNIPVAAAGNYTISLNIGIGGNYSYKLKKN